MMGRLVIEQIDDIEQLRRQVAELSERLDQALTMILERDQTIAEQAKRLAERDAKLPGYYNLMALKECADDATLDAFDHIKDFAGCAINWGDLSCVGAERYVTEQGTVGHRVWIEECDPAAYQLRDFVREWLTHRGFIDVDVMLEW